MKKGLLFGFLVIILISSLILSSCTALSSGGIISGSDAKKIIQEFTEKVIAKDYEGAYLLLDSCIASCPEDIEAFVDNCSYNGVMLIGELSRLAVRNISTSFYSTDYGGPVCTLSLIAEISGSEYVIDATVIRRSESESDIESGVENVQNGYVICSYSIEPTGK